MTIYTIHDTIYITGKDDICSKSDKIFNCKIVQIDSYYRKIYRIDSCDCLIYVNWIAINVNYVLDTYHAWFPLIVSLSIAIPHPCLNVYKFSKIYEEFCRIFHNLWEIIQSTGCHGCFL